MSEAAPQRIRRSREQWQRLIHAQTDSGLTQSAFCRANSIPLASFQNWKRRLAAEEPAESWFELGALEAAQATRWDIELQLGDGICLRLRRC